MFLICVNSVQDRFAKNVLVVKGRQSGYAMELLKFSIASFDNRKNSAKCLENPASRLAIKDRQDDI